MMVFDLGVLVGLGSRYTPSVAMGTSQTSIRDIKSCPCLGGRFLDYVSTPRSEAV